MSLPVPTDGATLPAASWSLGIYSTTGAFIKNITQATSPNPIRGHVEAVVTGCDRTESIRFDCIQTIAQLEPRQLVQFSAAPDGTLVAAGVIVRCPPVTAPGAGPADVDRAALEGVTCVGLEQLVTESVVGPLLIEVDTDVSSIAYQLCAAAAHPALTVDAADFPASGFVLGAFFKPYATLTQCLDELRDALPAGGCWGVRPDFSMHFTPNPTGS